MGGRGAGGESGWGQGMQTHVNITRMDAGGAYSLLGAFGGGVLGGGKTHSGSCMIIKIYPALSLAIGGWDGMDGSGGHWMTF